MIQLSRIGIRNIASSDVVYSRGLQDYKNNHVVNATWSNSKQQYRITVKDNFNYNVTIKVFEDGSFEHSCNCSEHLKENGACKHVVTALLFVLNYVERSLLKEPDNPEEKKIYQIIEYFSNEEISMVQGETYHMEVTVTIPSLLRGKEGNAFASIRVGNSRLYKIQSIKKFLLDMYGKENIVLGKEFKFVHGESKFDKQSNKILDYFLEILEIQEAVDKMAFPKLFNRSQIILTKNMLLRLLNILGDNKFRLELYGKEYENVIYSASNPNIKYNLSMIEDGIVMDYNGNYHVIPLTDTGELLYFNGCIFKPNKRFTHNYVPFFNNLGGNREPLVFKGVHKNKFLEVVLPKISEIMELTVPEELQDRFITENLEPIVYLDRAKNHIRAELKFKYGEHEFNAFDNPSAANFIIVRQPMKEDYYLEYLEKLGFVPKSHSFIMRNEDDIYEFLTNSIHDLAKECELYYSDDFKKINIKSPGSFKAGLSVSTGVDLLEMDLNYEEVPKDELQNLFKSYRMKKKYYRLKNGSFINLEDESIKNVWDILNNLNVSGKELDKEKIEVSKNAAVYLNNAFSELNLEVEKNEDFFALVDSILNPSATQYLIPNGIEATLRPYQVIGYKWLRTLADNGLGGILADDMGLGKTLQSIVYMASIIEDSKEKSNDVKKKKSNKIVSTVRGTDENASSQARFLIVCPSSLIYNWQDEVDNFAPYLTTEVITGSPKERQELIESDRKADIIITSYPLIRRDIELYEQIQFHTVFIDEAQYIKNADSLNAKSVKLIKAQHKFALTGTPIENSLSELWSIFDFIMPNYLFSHSKFVNIYEKPIKFLISYTVRLKPYRVKFS